MSNACRAGCSCCFVLIYLYACGRLGNCFRSLYSSVARGFGGHELCSVVARERIAIEVRENVGSRNCAVEACLDLLVLQLENWTFTRDYDMMQTCLGRRKPNSLLKSYSSRQSWSTRDWHQNELDAWRRSTQSMKRTNDRPH